MNTHAVVFDVDGRVDRLTQSAPDDLPEGMSSTQLAEPVRAWPTGPSSAHVLYCSLAGELLWVDPRSADAKRADAEAAALAQRAALLAATDWVTLRAIDTGAPVPTDWRIYRQALRDVTLQAGYPFAVQWPTEPGS